MQKNKKKNITTISAWARKKNYLKLKVSQLHSRVYKKSEINLWGIRQQNCQVQNHKTNTNYVAEKQNFKSVIANQGIQIFNDEELKIITIKQN